METPADRLPRRALRDLPPYIPGTSSAEVQRRYGITAPVKLSQNENPLGTSPRALAAVRALETFSDYMEEDHLELRGRLARRYGLEIDRVVCGHGSNELIALAFTAFVDPGDDVVIAQPTFSLYKKDAGIAGARAIEVPLVEGVHDLAAMLAAVTPRTKLVFVCDPNNPTGTHVEREALLRFARALPPDVLLVVDQAYVEYAGADACDAVDILAERPRTLVLRTSSKIYGLAAIRFGYGYSSPEIVAWLNAVRVPFNVARPAAAAMLAALDDDEFLARSRRTNEEGKAYLGAAFARLGLHAFPTSANFIAVGVPVEADLAYRSLLARGIIVRSGDGLRMPGYVRVTVGTREQNEAFVNVLEDLLPAWRGALPARVAG
jgi:histidinol-phosphate aminotransferase